VRRGAMNILFVMKHRGNAGSTHAVANYMRLAPKHGHSVAIFGTPIWYVPELKFSTDIAEFDRVIYLFETELFRIQPLHQAIMLARFPRQDRLIVDTDGMYNELVTVDGYDFNHPPRRIVRSGSLHGCGRRQGRPDTDNETVASEGERAAILRL
jgi:hypothetical protein